MLGALISVLMFAGAVEDRLPDPPTGLDLYMPIPEANPVTREKVALGRRLFFDKSLSADGTLSCSTCHDPERSFADDNAVAIGIHRRKGARNAPALINRGYGASHFWDGRARTLEQQVLEPIFNANELGSTREVLERSTGMAAAKVAEALASFVRTIRSGNSRFDRFVAGDRRALTPLQEKGLNIFRGRGNCVSCHVGPNFTDEQFHNTGVAWSAGLFWDRGRAEVTQDDSEEGAFKTPTLRDVSRTAPYMHDGSFRTLEDVVEFYSTGARPNPRLDREIAPRNFTQEERRALVAFLRALDGEVQEGWR